MSNSTSDTEAGLPGGNFRSKFSLYSTDTEEKVSTAMHHEMKSLLLYYVHPPQVASVNRGLDRCAALLETLLTPDNVKDGN